MPVRTPRMDMTPMVDLFCLLLTFFMLTAQFRPQEAVQVDTPSSVSEMIAPDRNVMTISISDSNKVFFNVDNGLDSSMHVRKKLIVELAKYKGMELTPEQITTFEKLNSFGMPIKEIGAWLDAEGPDREGFQVGIPMDSVNNELALWVHFTRVVNNNAEATIKGDSKSDYKTVKKVIDILQAKNINRFNLTTNLEKQEIKPEDLN